MPPKMANLTKVDVSADITGRITKLAVREGDWVQKGQFLLQIDPTIYEANVQRAQALVSSSEAGAVQAKANRDQAKRNLDRTRELRTQNENLVSAEQLEQAQTAWEVSSALSTSADHQVDQARAGLREAKDQLSKAVDQHGDKIAKGVDAAADALDKKTGGKHGDKIAKGSRQAKDALDKLDGRDDDIK